MSRPSELSNTYYQHLLRVVGVAASTIPFLVIGLGLLVKFGLLNNQYYAGDVVFAGISVGFVACAAVNYYAVFVKKNPPYAVYLGLSIAFHTLGAAFLLFVCGVFSPFLIAWVLMTVAVDLYFGKIATLTSMTVLCLTCLSFFLLNPTISSHEQIGVFGAILLVVATCITLSRLHQINEQERMALAETGDQASVQRERLLALVNSMGDAVVTTDEKGNIKVYNAATLSLLNTNKNLNDQNIDNILQLQDTEDKEVNIMSEALKRRRVFSRNDLVHTLKDGESINIYLNVAPVRPGYHSKGERGYIFILRDITKEKSLEEERDEFISVVSHELRTPIAIAEGTISNLMILHGRNAAKSVVTDAVKDAHDQVMFLGKLVNDLSTLSRAERGVDSQIEVMDLNILLQDMYKEYAGQAAAKQLKLDLDSPHRLPQMITSKLYLKEMLQNFITNAIKYTREGTVTISARKDKSGLQISIGDTGIGMSKYDQKRIFKKFYRSEDYRTRETSGTGLGLYVCRKLAEKLHVGLDFESRLNHGSTFTISVPESQLTNDPVVVKPSLPTGYVPTR